MKSLEHDGLEFGIFIFEWEVEVAICGQACIRHLTLEQNGAKGMEQLLVDEAYEFSDCVDVLFFCFWRYEGHDITPYPATWELAITL